MITFNKTSSKFNGNKDAHKIKIDATTKGKIAPEQALAEPEQRNRQDEHESIYVEEYSAYQQKLAKKNNLLLKKLLDPPENPINRAKRILKKSLLGTQSKNNNGFSR
jgi:hypothetical protein